MDKKTLHKQIKKKLIKDADLTKLDLSGYDFSDCVLDTVIFAKEGKTEKNLMDINFNGAKLKSVYFEGATLNRCNFDGSSLIEGPNLVQVSFRKSTLENCRFREANLEKCDFREVEISKASFEDTVINYCDFYRAVFLGVVVFRGSLISNTSLYHAYFGEGSIFRKSNLVDGKILHQDKKVYHEFLHYRKQQDHIDKELGVSNPNFDWNPEKSFSDRLLDAEEIFKNFNGIWNSQGFMSDSNWAYVMGRRQERKRMAIELVRPKIPFKVKFSNSIYIIRNMISDLMFGYGESLTKMVVSYLVIVVIFAYAYYASPDVTLPSYVKALGISLKNMVAMTSPEVTNKSVVVDLLNVVQSTLGILITGIFGFMLGNKIRNQ